MITQLLLEHIKQKIAGGWRDEEIKKILQKKGYSEEEIKEAFFWLWYFSATYNATNINYG